jgi:hypothetical protein
MMAHIVFSDPDAQVVGNRVRHPKYGLGSVVDNIKGRYTVLYDRPIQNGRRHSVTYTLGNRTLELVYDDFIKNFKSGESTVA